MGIFCRDQAQLFDRLAAVTDGGGDPLMAIGLDAIQVGVKHQGAVGRAMEGEGDQGRLP